MWLQSPQDGLAEKWCPELQPLFLSRGRESQVEAGSTPAGGPPLPLPIGGLAGALPKEVERRFWCGSKVGRTG